MCPTYALCLGTVRSLRGRHFPGGRQGLIRIHGRPLGRFLELALPFFFLLAFLLQLFLPFLKLEIWFCQWIDLSEDG